MERATQVETFPSSCGFAKVRVCWMVYLRRVWGGVGLHDTGANCECFMVFRRAEIPRLSLELLL